MRLVRKDSAKIVVTVIGHVTKVCGAGIGLVNASVKKHEKLIKQQMS